MLKYVLTIMLVGTLVVGTLTAERNPGQREDEAHLTVVVPTPVRNIFPPSAIDPVTAMTTALVHEPLVAPDEHGQLVPVLARVWYTQDAGRTWRVQLRNNVHWHDESRFTADDVRATYEHIMTASDPPSPLRPLLADVLEIEVVHDSKLQIVFRRSFTSPPELMTIPIVSAAALEEYGVQSYNYQSVGTGPFKMEKWSPHGQTLLVANESHWRGAPLLDAMSIVPVENPQLRRRAVETGTAHIALQPAGEHPGDVALPLTDVVYLSLRDEPPVLADPRTRRAVAIALNRAWEKDPPIDAPGASGPWPPISALHSTDNGTDGEDPVGLLQEAGWSHDRREGVLISGNERAQFDLLTPLWREIPTVADWTADVLCELGILVQPEVASLLQTERRLLTGQFTAALAQLQIAPGIDLRPMLSSDGPYNDGRYRNPRMDLLLEKLCAAGIEQQRSIKDEILYILQRDVPAVWLYNPREVVAVGPEVAGLTWAPGPLLARPHQIHLQR